MYSQYLQTLSPYILYSYGTVVRTTLLLTPAICNILFYNFFIIFISISDSNIIFLGLLATITPACNRTYCNQIIPLDNSDFFLTFMMRILHVPPQERKRSSMSMSMSMSMVLFFLLLSAMANGQESNSTSSNNSTSTAILPEQNNNCFEADPYNRPNCQDPPGLEGCAELVCASAVNVGCCEVSYTPACARLAQENCPRLLNTPAPTNTPTNYTYTYTCTHIDGSAATRRRKRHCLVHDNRNNTTSATDQPLFRIESFLRMHR